jgi:hypothetical protein
MYHHLASTEKRYVGRAIQSIDRIDMAAVLITFVDGKKTELSVCGDCCSTSIFYEIDLPEKCIGSEILSLEEGGGDNVSLEEEDIAYNKALILDTEFYRDCLRVWDVVFKTKAGDIRIKHINSSNGYYDGSTNYKDL